MLRRRFVGSLAALAALPHSARALTARVFRRGDSQTSPSQAMIRALGEALLPSELGRARIEVASDSFWRWMTGYRQDAELLHPYGSPRLSYAGPSPVTGWTKDLQALDTSARAKHGAGFVAISANSRQALVREALQGIKGDQLPNVASAPHVALGMLAHFYGSSEATDLCYRAQIGRNKCRPLAHNGRKPLPIATS
jgi:hypothetical protein